MSAAKKPAHTPGEWESDPSYKRARALGLLGTVSTRFPELRLCQLIVNAVGVNDPFYITDEALSVALIRYRDEHAKEAGHGD